MRILILLAIVLIGLAAPARAADDVAAAQSVIRAQEQAFSRDDPAAAYSHAAPTIQGIFPDAETFMAMVRNSYAPVYRHKSFEFGEAPQPTAGSRSAFISSTPRACRGRRCIRWSFSRMAV
jgi:hypothetical protein